jgi:hypothetical protein
LLGTEFYGIMRHSPEASIDEALAAGNERYLFDGTRSKVTAEWSASELRVLAEDEEFHYRRPQPLLAKFDESLRTTPPLRSNRLLNGTGLYTAPYGFLTCLSELIRGIAEGRATPALTFVFNAKPYRLEVLGVKRLETFETRLPAGVARYTGTALARFRCFNTVKRTRTEFSLWIPTTGELKGVPVRILLQPRWWLRLQMDLDPAASRFRAAL